ncbi:MAG: peptidylprolyl isomerase [Burkholderiales bacterium]|nr:peptidylprolyl isomerase [Burkholderiales bacterium]
MNSANAAKISKAAPADAATDAVATVNGKPILQSRIDFLMKSRGVQDQSGGGENLNQALNMLISQELLYQEAVKLGYETKPDVATRIEINKEETVIDAYLWDCAQSRPIGEDKVIEAYEYQKALFGDKEYKARHILVDTEDEASQILGQLEKGTSFEELAIEHSVDGGSKFRGGDLDWASPLYDLPQFHEAMKMLEKGQVTQAPVQTEFGWHIIRVDDERPLDFPALEEVKPKIYTHLQRQAVDALIAELRAKAEIE